MSDDSARAGGVSGSPLDPNHARRRILPAVSEFLARQIRPSGELICPRHRVEHTGKNVYAAVIDLENWRTTREERYLARAKAAVLRAVSRLGEDPLSRVPIFLPGRTDPRNASSNAIDGGAVADSIATLLEEVPEIFEPSERERCTAALSLHVDVYLRHAARTRPITAQRLWAGTGVARAARLLRRDDWAEDALAGCALALDELTEDGVAPYIPEGSADCTHPGLAETSTFYHSRTPGFVLYIHEILGRKLSPRHEQRVRASLDALVAMRGGRGVKVLNNEAKPWYWESAYEVASHPFDVYALQRGGRMFDGELYRNEAGRAMAQWIAHLEPDGGVTSHRGRGVNFQCRIFWNAHAAWIARVIGDVALEGAPRAALTFDLARSGLVHVETPRAVAVLRGRHRRAGNLFGCDAGGGSLQSLVARARPADLGGEELVTQQRFVRRREGSFRLRPRGGAGRVARLAALLRSERSDLRFRLYLASVEWRAARPWGALLYPLRHVLLRSFQEASPWLASHLDLDTEHSLTSAPGGGTVVEFRGGLADRDGLRWPGARTLRRYEFGAERVALVDTLTLSGVAGRVSYLLPARLTEVSVSCRGATHRISGQEVSLAARGGEVELVVRGAWLI